MTFGTIAKAKIESATQEKILKEQQEIERQQRKSREPFEYYHSIVNEIKTRMFNIESGNSKFETNTNGEVFLCTSKKHSKHYDYDSKISKVGFFEHFSKFIPSSEFIEFQEFLKQQNVISIFIYDSHDGIGRESWNSFYAKI